MHGSRTRQDDSTDIDNHNLNPLEEEHREKPVIVVNKVHESIDNLIESRKELAARLAELESELHEVKAHLAQAGKLATLGTMGASIAHELNNPLTVVSAEADELLDAIDNNRLDDELTTLAAHNIKKCAERMRHIIDHIRKYSRDEKASPWEKLDINESIKDSLIILKAELKNSDIETDISFNESLPRIWGHANKLESVFQNIISNAKDALLKINNATRKKISITTAQDDQNNIVVTISDNGCGMPKKVQARIFKPFYTTKEAGSGTGLGMSIAQDIVKEHKGRILLESSPGRGTSFTLIFPQERRTIGRDLPKDD
jgi:histidine kinase